MTWLPLRECFDPSPVPDDPSRRALEWVRRAWPSLAGPLGREAVAPKRLDRRGMLTLTVGDQALLPRLQSERAELLKRLRSFLGAEMVSGVRWELGPCPIPAAPPPVRRPRALAPEAAAAAAAISDPSLRERFMAACRGLSGDGGPAPG